MTAQTDTHAIIFGVPHFAVDFHDFDSGRHISRQWRQVDHEDAIEAICETGEAIADREGCTVDISIGGERAGIRVRSA